MDHDDALILLQDLLGICRRALARTNGCPDLDEIDHCAAELEHAIDGHWAHQVQIDAQHDEHDDPQLSFDPLDDELPPDVET